MKIRRILEYKFQKKIGMPFTTLYLDQLRFDSSLANH